MTRPDSPELEAFKQALEFDARIEPPGLTQGVCAAWRNPFNEPDLIGPGWTLTSESTSRFYPCASRRWVATQGDARVLVTITVSSTGPQAVQGHFLAALEATTLPTIGFQPAYPDLGTLCVGESRADDETLMWLYRNVLFEVTSFSSNLDIEGLARWLQAWAEQHLVEPLARALPPVGRLELSAQHVHVGQQVHAQLVADGREGTFAEPACYEVDGPTLIVLDGANIEARRAGQGPVRAVRFDAATLLQGASTALIHVTP